MIEPANLLLVDDTLANLVALEAVLSGPDRTLVMVQSGSDALREAQTRDFALIILDVNMPLMDGYEAASRLRQFERSRHTPIIFLTALSSSEIRVFDGYSRGAVDFIFKPFDSRVLRSKVDVFIELARQTNEVRRLNHQLGARTRELSIANADLESFAHSVSHDVRAPLRSIRGFAGKLAETGDTLPAESQDAVRRILLACARMTALTDDLLRLSHVTRANLRRSEVDLSSLAHDVADELSTTEPQRVVEWEIEGGLLTEADPGLTRILLENLLGNAFKFTRDRPRAQIGLVRGTNPAGHEAFVVRDNGPGFDMRHASELFKPFRRLHSDAEFEGTGIGLATVHRVVRRHGGEISAHAEPDCGATFWFTLGTHP
ncbi:MAG: response regulator [Planctomycetota bacterium]